jgi:hypothetical protein
VYGVLVLHAPGEGATKEACMRVCVCRGLH